MWIVVFSSEEDHIMHVMRITMLAFDLTAVDDDCVDSCRAISARELGGTAGYAGVPRRLQGQQ